MLLQELRALGLKPELLKFKDEVTPEERVTIEEGETEVVELAEDTGEGSDITAEDKGSERKEKSTETAKEVKEGIEEGNESDASGVTMEQELKESVISEEAHEAA